MIEHRPWQGTSTLGLRTLRVRRAAANENTNGLVRQYVPKWNRFKAISHRAVAAIQSSLNNRPRKRLGYRTPNEILKQYAQRRSVAFDI